MKVARKDISKVFVILLTAVTLLSAATAQPGGEEPGGEEPGGEEPGGEEPGGEEPGGENRTTFYANDNFNYQNTSSSYKVKGENINISFLSHDVVLHEAQADKFYNLTDAMGNLVDKVTTGLKPNGFNSLSTENAEEGVHYAWDVNKSNKSRIDLVSDFNDVTGRINGKTGSISDKNDIDIKLYYWENNSEVQNFDSEVVSWRKPTNEYLYRLNTTLKDYWISVDADGFGETVKATRGQAIFDRKTNLMTTGVSKPRINDFMVRDGSNLSGRLINTSSNPPTSVSGLQVRLTGHASQDKYPTRSVRFESPPVRTDITDNNGFYNFTGLSQGGYNLEVTNNSVAKTKNDFFRPDVSINSPNTDKRYDVKATEALGNITVNLDANTGSNIEYAVAALGEQSGRREGGGSSASYVKNGIEPGNNIVLEDVRNQTYNVLALKVTSESRTDTSPSFQFDEGRASVSMNGEAGPVNLSFESLVRFNGTVQDTNGNPAQGASVVLENRSENKFYFARTNSRGEFSKRVAETDYNVRIRPRFDSPLKENETSLDVTQRKSQVFNLSEGTSLSGRVTNSEGKVVEEAFVQVENESEKSFGFSQVNETGHYTINGLEQISYDLRVEPFEPSLQSKTKSVEINSDDADENVQLGLKKKVKMNGTVTNATGSPLNATVRVRSEEAGLRSKVPTDVNGTYSVDGLPPNSFYQIEVEPENKVYSDAERFAYLKDNTTEEFNLSRLSGIKGYVNDQGGNPMTGVTVYASNFSEGSFDSDRTNQDGFYSLEIKKVNHQVEVFPGVGSSYTENFTSVEASDVKDTGIVNLTLSKGTSLSGNISPLTNDFKGEIRLFNESENAFAFTEFEGGNYTLDGLKDGVNYSVFLRVKNESFEPRRTYVKVSGQTEKNFSYSTNIDGRKIEITVREEVNNNTRGTVANATISLSSGEKTTGPNGTLRLPRKKANDKITFSAFKEGYVPRSKSITVKKRKTKNNLGTTVEEWQNVSIGLEHAELAESNTTEFDIEVNLTRNSKNIPGSSVTFVENSSSISEVESAVVPDEGNATVTGLIEGNYLVTASFAGEADPSTNSTFINSTATGSLELKSGGKTYNLQYGPN